MVTAVETVVAVAVVARAQHEMLTVVGIAGEAAVALMEVVAAITADGDDGHSLSSSNHRLLQWPSTTH